MHEIKKPQVFSLVESGAEKDTVEPSKRQAIRFISTTSDSVGTARTVI